MIGCRYERTSMPATRIPICTTNRHGFGPVRPANFAAGTMRTSVLLTFFWRFVLIDAHLLQCFQKTHHNGYNTYMLYMPNSTQDTRLRDRRVSINHCESGPRWTSFGREPPGCTGSFSRPGIRRCRIVKGLSIGTNSRTNKLWLYITGTRSIICFW